MSEATYDWIIIGSGFGGSVSALRLSEKGYRVLVIEKGRRFEPKDFPKSNWDLKRWFWKPRLGWRGIFQMSFLKHVTILHGVGVGGGSLVYANTLPTPKASFFSSASWAHLADWKQELSPHYETAKRMLGAAKNPYMVPGDHVLKEIAEEMGRPEHFHSTEVGVYFGEAGKKVPDPYFEGRGPERVGCNFCGACMTGCRVGAKNTLDRNYLYLAEKNGAEIAAETEVLHVRPETKNDGYNIETRSTDGKQVQETYHAKQVIFAGGVMGTIPLLLRMKQDPQALPSLSEHVGNFVRTNNEALIGVIAPDKKHNFSKGVAITSILHTDEHSHVEPVHYAEGSGFFRALMLPHASNPSLVGRLLGVARNFLRQPWRWLAALFVRDHARNTQILLYMRTLEETLRLKLRRNLWSGFRQNLTTQIDDPSAAPTAIIPEATALADSFAEKTGGVTATLLTESILGIPSTAHILGGACMGDSIDTGVIDSQHRVFGYAGLYVIDGSAVSANPGVNPSLTITALAERAMSFIPPKDASRESDKSINAA